MQKFCPVFRNNYRLRQVKKGRTIYSPACEKKVLFCCYSFQSSIKTISSIPARLAIRNKNIIENYMPTKF